MKLYPKKFATLGESKKYAHTGHHGRQERDAGRA